MAKQKPLNELSPAYRRRLERVEAKAKREGKEFSRAAARGHKTTDQGTEYQRRKQSEKQRSEFYPLTPSEIRQCRKFGADDDGLSKLAKLPHSQVQQWLKEQRAHARNPGYKAPWSLADRIAEAEAKYGNVPAFVFFYHSWR